MALEGIFVASMITLVILVLALIAIGKLVFNIVGALAGASYSDITRKDAMKIIFAIILLIAAFILFQVFLAYNFDQSKQAAALQNCVSDAESEYKNNCMGHWGHSSRECFFNLTSQRDYICPAKVKATVACAAKLQEFARDPVGASKCLTKVY